MIRSAVVADAAACAAIYEYYIVHTACTFQEMLVSSDYFAKRIDQADGDAPFFVAVEGSDRVAGYAYADQWRGRCGYRYTTEVSVYVDKDMVGKGVGGLLLDKLVWALGQSRMRLAVAVIALPNPASIRLHEKFGFVHSGELRGAGWKFDAPHNVGFWALSLRD